MSKKKYILIKIFRWLFDIKKLYVNEEGVEFNMDEVAKIRLLERDSRWKHGELNEYHLRYKNGMANYFVVYKPFRNGNVGMEN